MGQRRQHRVYDLRTGSVGRRRRALTAVAGWLVVVLNLIVAFGAAPVRLAPVENEQAGLAELLGQNGAEGAIAICSAKGLGTISADGNPEPLKNRNGGGHAGACAFCLPLLSTGMTVPLALEPVRYPTGSGLVRLAPQVVGAELAEPLAVASRPRAPPAEASG